ncbi:MAG TPA: cupin domain-containing protein [Candidatus Angelobacter sp.]|nr:cupin domain-containing protein [Candidatus Angelobacter sp.]
MRITRLSDTSSEPMASDHFAGAVSRRDYGAIETPPGSALRVRFPAGARTHWHAHPGGQVLYVTEGHGSVGTRDGRVERIAAGDLVVTPPGEEHWHGAAAEGELEHLALSFGDTTWAEKVED